MLNIHLSTFRKYIFVPPTSPFSDPADKARHDKLVSFVERMLELLRRSPRMPQEKESLQREIEPAADGRIDRVVNELYGLSEEEIRIVES